MTVLIDDRVERSKVREFRERLMLTATLRGLQSRVLVKQLDAAQKIEAFMGLIEPPPAQALQFGVSPAPPTWRFEVLTVSDFVAWLEHNGVLAIMLGPEAHESLIRRVPPILRFLFRCAQLRPAHIDMVWAAGLGKAESVATVVYDMLSDLTPSMSEAHLNAVLTRIRQRQPHEYRELDVHFVRNFTQAAVKPRPVAAHAAPANWYGLDVLWQLVQSPVPIDERLLKAVVDDLVWLLSTPHIQSQRPVYIAKAIQILPKQKSSAAEQKVILVEQKSAMVDQKSTAEHKSMGEREMGGAPHNVVATIVFIRAILLDLSADSDASKHASKLEVSIATMDKQYGFLQAALVTRPSLLPHSSHDHCVIGGGDAIRGAGVQADGRVGSDP